MKKLSTYSYQRDNETVVCHFYGYVEFLNIWKAIEIVYSSKTNGQTPMPSIPSENTFGNAFKVRLKEN